MKPCSIRANFEETINNKQEYKPYQICILLARNFQNACTHHKCSTLETSEDKINKMDMSKHLVLFLNHKCL